MYCLVSQSLCTFFSFYHCWHLVLFHDGKLEFRYYFHFPIFVDWCHILWYILNKVPCAAEKDRYSLAFVGEVPQICQVHFIYDATNFCFCVDLYTGESGVLNSLTMTGLRLICVSTSSSICFMKLCAPMFATYMSRIIIYSLKVFFR